MLVSNWIVSRKWFLALFGRGSGCSKGNLQFCVVLVISTRPPMFFGWLFYPCCYCCIP